MDAIFFVYGLSFIVLALIIIVQPKEESRHELAEIIWILVVFGFTHGMAEWLDLWTTVRGRTPALETWKVSFLLVSFGFLFEFGRRLMLATRVPALAQELLGRPIYGVVALGFLLEFMMIPDPVLATDIASRYFLGFTGSTLTGIGFLLYFNRNIEQQTGSTGLLWTRKYFILAAMTFLLYGVVGGLVVPAADVFPANAINQEWFLSKSPIPVQLVRATCAALATIAVANILRIFHEEARERLRTLLALAEQRTQDLVATTTKLEREMGAREELERKILEISEEEQARIGRELHDDLGQLLTGAAYLAGALANTLARTDQEASRQAGDIKKIAQDAIKRTRYISHGLIPFNIASQGLRQGLEQLANDVSALSGIPCDVRFAGDTEVSDFMLATHLYRIAQEALNNAIKHSSASRLAIELSATPGEIRLSIADNGVGLPGGVQDDGKGAGMMNMKYRAQIIGATIALDAREGKGTTVTLVLPYAPP